jgi:DNA primase
MAGFFSPATLDQVRAASDIVEVVGSVLPLKRAGANFVALCPFHKEKTPSFNVNPQRQIFHCFGCHKGGDVFTFIREFENITFPEAVRRLAERARIPLPEEPQSGESESRRLKETLLQIHEQIAQRWQSALATEAAGQVARDYLARRGVTSDAVELFRLGYAPELWDDTVNWARSKGYEPALVEKAGLILRKPDTDRFYDRFRGRLMFPICDEQGRVIGFSGRILSGDEKTAKYVNSPETPIFTKSRVFFGLDKSKRALLDAGFAVVCEGQLDLIACFMAGIRNVVAPQGTAFTGDQAHILKRYVDEVVLCFDSDEAGQNAAVRSLDHLLASGLAVRVAVVPAPHDPDSYIKANGGEAFRKLIDQAGGFFDYYLQRLCATHGVTTDKGRLAILRDMAEAVHKTGNVVLLDTYAQKTALRLGVGPEAVRAEFQKATAVAARAPAAPDAGEAEPEAPRVSPQELLLLRFLFDAEEHLDWLATNLEAEWINHPLVRDLFRQRLELHRSGAWQGVADFLTRFEPGHGLITEALTRELVMHSDGTRYRRKAAAEISPTQLRDVVMTLRNLHLDRQLTALTQRLADPATTDADRQEIVRQQAELRQAKARPVPLPA